MLLIIPPAVLKKPQSPEIPRKTIYRLSVYLRCLARLKDKSIQTVSSETLAKVAGVKPTQLRKDLTYLGQFGTRGLGYDVAELSKMISDELGTTSLQPVILIGVGTYYVWYVKGESKPAAPPQASATKPAAATAARVTVKISNFQFTPKEVTIPAGATVEWIDEGGRHTVEADDGSFKSDTLTANGKYEHTFDKPGAYPYFCTFHGDKHGVDMAGVINVTEASK